MLKSIIYKVNQFCDWFITEKSEITKIELFNKRRFVEAVMMAIVASFIGLILKWTGIRESFPLEWALLACIGVLVLYRLSANNILAGNLFVGFFFLTLIYDIILSDFEIVTYYRWLLILPLFSLLFINRNSGIFWSVAIFIVTIALCFVKFSPRSILHESNFKLFFTIDTLLFYTIFLTFLYVFYKGKNLINEALYSERKELELQTNNLMLMQQQILEKNNDLKTYAHVVSHDLKTPLRGIIGFTDILIEQLEKEKKLTGDSQVHLKFIKENALQMEELITDILRYAELSNATTSIFKSYDLNVLLKQAINNFSDKKIKDSIIIHRQKLPAIAVLPSQVKQIFQNLISNSVKFKASNKPLQIEIFEKDFKDHIEFTFQDNGIGVKEDNLEYMFLPFKRLNNHSKYNGSGIGLANCAKVVKRHNGTIWAESEFGKGLKITFTLSKNLK